MAFQERYQPQDSPLHHLDPRVKVVSSFLMILGISLTPHTALPAFPLLWALVASLAAVGQLSVLRVGRRAMLALPFALAALTLTFTTPGPPLFSIAGLTISSTGLNLFLVILLKSWLTMQVALLLAMTTTVTDLLWALSSLRLPQTLVMILGFTYRYLFTLHAEAVRLQRARAARSGVDPAYRPRYAPGARLLWRARVTGGMIGSLFVRSLDRSERVYLAMQARGYRGELRVLNAPRLTGAAVLRGALPLLLLAGIELLALTFWSR